MRKTFTFLFAGTAALALAACGGEAGEGYGEAEDTMAEDTMAEDAMADEATAEASAEAEATDNNDGLGGTGNPAGPLAEDAEAEIEE